MLFKRNTDYKVPKSTTQNKPKTNKGKGIEVGRMIPIQSLVISQKQQPRRFFDAKKMEQLRESIRKYGILEPLIVREHSNKTYELIAGERRYRAAKAENFSEVPVIIRSLDDQAAYELALLENLQRDDLNPIEETDGILELLCKSLDSTREEIISLLNRAANAERRGLNLTDNVTRQIEVIDKVFSTVGRLNRESFRSNRLPLLNLPADVLEILRSGELEYTKAKVIARIEDEDDRKAFTGKVVAEKLSLREVKRRIQNGIYSNNSTAKDSQKNSALASLTPHKNVPTTTSASVEIGSLQQSFLSLVERRSPAWNTDEKQSRLQELFSELSDILSV